MKDLHVPGLFQQRALVATVLLSFVLLVGSAALVWRLARIAELADRWVDHTLQTKSNLDELVGLMTSAESGQRGYLITGDRTLLEPFEKGRPLVKTSLEKLRALVADNPPQVTRVDELAAVIERRFAAMDTALGFNKDARFAEMVLTVRGPGQTLMSDFRAHVREIDRVENELLAQRQQAVTTTRERFVQAMSAMMVACGVLALFALVSVRRYFAALEASRTLLHDQNRLLEERVHERTVELERAAEIAVRERSRAESLLTDVNHRVGNNLALVSSFLTMQLRAVKHPEAAKALDAARARVQAIASAHRKLRLGADFATVRANEVLAAVIDDIAAGLPPGEAIKISYDVAPLEINARDAVSLGVLTSELVMNAVKHAFGAGESGQVSVEFKKPGAAAPYLEVADNGVGCHEKQKQESGSLGSKIIEMVARQFGGKAERGPLCDDQQRPGTRIKIELNNLQSIQQLG